MTDKERLLFEKLRAHRIGATNYLQHKDMRGFWTSVIDKYPESAHFVYELLQNADDAQATCVEIVVNKDGLILKHNGKIHFDITDIDDDSVQGHINALTAVGNSNKKSNLNTIGKFGVGFKAVFQYTDYPEIYDDNFKFKLVNRMIPEEILEDHPLRKPGETLFYFPFKDIDKSYKEVKERLNSLDNPILFLRHIDNLRWREEDESLEYEYTKEVLKEYTYLTNNDLTCRLLAEHNANMTVKMIMFEREVDVDGTLFPINIAYYITKTGDLDLTVPSRVFCYFPTKEHFHSKHFICHAPFLLVDSRQNFRPGEEVNEFLTSQLAHLEADALPVLRDIGIENKHPLIHENISNLLSLSRCFLISYGQYAEDIFYPKEIAMIAKEPMVLCQDGKYRLFTNCFFCHPRSLYDVFSSEQLNQLMLQKDVFALVSSNIEIAISQSNSYQGDFREYCKARGMKDLNTDVLSKSITSEFMSLQPESWLPKFYRFLNSEVVNVWKDKNGSFRKVPFIKTKDNVWVPPYTDSGNLNVFLPLDVDTNEYNIIHPFLMQNEQTSRMLLAMGIDKPNCGDYIETHLLRKYSESQVSAKEIEQDFEFIFSYYLGASEDEKQSLISLLKIRKYPLFDGQYLSEPQDLYLPDDRLKRFFEYSDCSFFDSESVKSTYNQHYKDEISEFLQKLGVKSYPSIESQAYSSSDCSALNVLERVESVNKREITKIYGATDYFMEGLDEYLDNNIEVPHDMAMLIWDTLCYNNLDDYRYLKLQYNIWHGKSERQAYGESRLIKTLRERTWLLGKKPAQVTLEEMRLSGFQENEELSQLFAIRARNEELKKAGLSEEQIEKLRLIDELQKDGVTNDDLRSFLQQRKMKRQLEQEAEAESEQRRQRQMSQEPASDPAKEETTTKTSNPKSRKEETKDLIEQHVDFSETWQKQFEEMKTKESHKPHAGTQTFSQKPDESEEEDDSRDSVFGQDLKGDDSFIKEQPGHLQNEADVNRSITEAQKNIEDALSEQDLRLRLNDAVPYSYEWFVLILGLQKLKQGKENKSKNQTISFRNFSLSDNGEILLLKDPNTPIPFWAEDASSITLAAYVPTVTVLDAAVINVDAFEGVVYFNVKNIEGILDIVSKAKKMAISCDSPNSLLESLMIHFSQLPYKKDDDLRSLLPEAIEFIYGPPGTGKTTEVISRISKLIDNAERNDSVMNILVLTPTNKAADVIVEDIILNSKEPNTFPEITESAKKCYPYTYRFGSTTSEIYREEYDRVKTRTDLFMDDLPINVVVTTIDRFPFDYVQPDDTYICDFPWNYIICDEASMIDLVKLVYVLLKGAIFGTKFIIAGDPKQIPSVNITGFDYGNIYRCVGLDNMQSAINNFKKYPLTPLLTQYRSIPAIGNLISEFSYDGLVKASRKDSESKLYQVDKFKFEHINFFGFKIKPFEMLYQRSSVDNSSINIYSILFTYLFVYYQAKQLKSHYPDVGYSIGIVSPYRAEADALRQIFENYPVVGTNCTIQCGTVHSFQGGQCDIMFVVMNPAVSNSKNAFVNTNYILNVAMSRARDYLFFIAPEGDKDALPIMIRLHSAIKQLGLNYSEYKCSDVEQCLFGDSEWINHNTIISSHSNVNTYSEMQSLFEIRQSENAIDIRMRKTTIINQLLGQ